MKDSLIQKNWFWVLAFVGVFLLSQDYLFGVISGEGSIFGFPKWLIYFMGVHALFILVFYFFQKKFWKES